MNISSSVVTPPRTGQASQTPSGVPLALSHARSSPLQSSPLCGPAMHATVALLHGPPATRGIDGVERDRRVEVEHGWVVVLRRGEDRRTGLRRAGRVVARAAGLGDA